MKEFSQKGQLRRELKRELKREMQSVQKRLRQETYLSRQQRERRRRSSRKTALKELLLSVERLTLRLNAAKALKAGRASSAADVQAAVQTRQKLKTTHTPAKISPSTGPSAVSQAVSQKIEPTLHTPAPIALTVREENEGNDKDNESRETTPPESQVKAPEAKEQVMANKEHDKLADAKRIVEEGLEATSGDRKSENEQPTPPTPDPVQAEPDREINEALEELAQAEHFEFVLDQAELEQHVAASVEEKNQSDVAEWNTDDSATNTATGSSAGEQASDTAGSEETADVQTADKLSADVQTTDEESEESDTIDVSALYLAEAAESAAASAETAQAPPEDLEPIPAQGAAYEGAPITFLADPFDLPGADNGELSARGSDPNDDEDIDPKAPLEELEMRANEDALRGTGLGDEVLDDDRTEQGFEDDEEPGEDEEDDGDFEIEFVPEEEEEEEEEEETFINEVEAGAQLDRLAEAMQEQTADQQRKMGEMTEALGLKEVQLAQPLGPLEDPVTLESLGLKDNGLEADAEAIATAEAEERRIQAELDEVEYDSDLPIDMETAEMQSAIEALLFVSDKPLPEKRLKETLFEEFGSVDLGINDGTNDDEAEELEAAVAEDASGEETAGSETANAESADQAPVEEDLKVRPDQDPEFMERYLTALDNLKRKYARPDSGIEMVRVNRGFQLRTKPRLARVAKRLGKVQTHKLSKGALESLAIIAYQQPVLKDDIDSIRGVDSSHFIRILLDKKLVKMAGRSELPGRPILYGTSTDFLEVFGLNSIDELPPLKELEQMIPGSEAGGEDEPHLRKMRELVGQMNEDKERLVYDPKEDDEFLAEIRQRVKQIVTTTPTLEAEAEQAKEAAKAEKEAKLAAEQNPGPEGSQPDLSVDPTV